jgi:hypothetical protein
MHLVVKHSKSASTDIQGRTDACEFAQIIEKLGYNPKHIFIIRMIHG